MSDTRMTDRAMTADPFDDYAECAVCWSDTRRLCDCGDPVCHNCGCPNGCAVEEAARPIAA